MALSVFEPSRFDQSLFEPDKFEPSRFEPGRFRKTEIKPFFLKRGVIGVREIWSSLSYQSLALFILLFSGLECAPAFLQGSNYQLVPKYKVFLRFLCYTTSMISSSESVRPDIKIREGGCSL